jgi:hypothetical protein
MKKAITKEEQQRINELLKARRTKQVEQLFPKKETSKSEDIQRMLEYEHDNTIGQYTNGLTYLEVEQFNNTYNNFK